MKTKLIKYLKAKLAAWVLSDPSILIQNNNQLTIDQKYEVITFSIIENTYNKLSMVSKETLMQIISCEFAKQIIENKVFDINFFNAAPICSISKPAMIVSMKVLIKKNK